MQYITEAEIDRIATETGAKLAKEKKVEIIIRPENGERFWEGGVNGHFFRIRTDVPVKVPESLYRLIGQANAVKLESEARARPFTRSGGKKVL